MNSRGVTVRRIAATPETVASIQAVIESAPEYSRVISGAKPEASAATSLFEALPSGKTYEDKYVLVVCLNERAVGVVDLIRGFPSADVAMLGLLLLSEHHQRAGLGRAAYTLVEQLVRQWPEVQRIRIGVVATNSKVLPYWQRMGFVATGETKPFSAGVITSQVVVLERNLQSVT